MNIEIILKKLLIKYKADLEKLRIEWQYGNINFDVYRMESQYSKGSINAIYNIANELNLKDFDKE